MSKFYPWKWTAAILVGSLLQGGTAPAAMAQLEPAFATERPLAGELAKGFFVFLPLFNSGTADADNVQVTSVKLDRARLTTPPLPVPIGTLSAGDYYELDLQFHKRNLVLGQKYRLIVRGTYEFSNLTFRFTVKRDITVSIPTGFKHRQLRHWVTLDAMQDFANSLPGVDPSADNEAMLTFIQSQPEFVDSGIDASSSSVWATFSNGEQVAFVNDLQVPAGSTTDNAPLSPQPPSVPGEMVGSTERVPLNSALEAEAVELPASSAVRLLNTLGFGFGASDEVNDLTRMLQPQNYQVNPQDPSVYNLKAVGGDGVLVFMSHGGFVGKAGSPTSPLRFGVWTSTKANSYMDTILPTSDVFGTTTSPSTLIRYLAKKEWNPLTASWVEEWHYAITATFVRTYFKAKPFSNNSFVDIEACSGDDPRTGPDSAQDFKQAIFDENASVYAGWTATLYDDIRTDSALLVFDRLLGANMFFPEEEPTPSGEVFAQRPFPWTSLSGTFGDLLPHNLGFDPKTKAVLNFTANPAQNEKDALIFGVLAPSIMNMEVTDGAPPPNFELNGVFGTANGSVTVGGSNPVPPRRTQRVVLS
jgi:hypothetical protein